MVLRRLVCLLILAACAAPVCASQRSQVKSDQQILVELEQSWNDAFYKKDLDVIKTLLADEFISTYDDGVRGDKAKELMLAAEFDQQVESAIQDEFTVKIYGDTAVVWFTLHVTGLKQGQKATLNLHYTDVWVLRDGRWQCVSAHSTRMTAK
jgi:ketosteroid isomerase-like protein